jgi:hypothetical protein
MTCRDYKSSKDATCILPRLIFRTDMSRYKQAIDFPLADALRFAFISVADKPHILPAER